MYNNNNTINNPYEMSMMSMSSCENSKITRRNQRERNRVKLINLGFQRLRSVVPCREGETLSKISTLKTAIWYIDHLAKLLDLPSATTTNTSSSLESEMVVESSSVNIREHKRRKIGTRNRAGTSSSNNPTNKQQQLNQKQQQNGPPIFPLQEITTASTPQRPTPMGHKKVHDQNINIPFNNTMSNSSSSGISISGSSGYITGNSDSSSSSILGRRFEEKFTFNPSYGSNQWPQLNGLPWLYEPGQNDENIPPTNHHPHHQPTTLQYDNNNNIMDNSFYNFLG